MKAWLQTIAAVPWLVWAWVALVLAYGLWRSVYRPDPDPVRRPGPSEPI